MKVLLVFSTTLILSYCDKQPTDSTLLKKIKKMTGTAEQPEENWRKCKPGDIHEDGCGSCTCGPKNLFECSWKHCVGPLEDWDEIILPHEVMDDEENATHVQVSSNTSLPFFYSVSKHDISVPFFYSVSKYTSNGNTDPKE